MSTQQNPSGPSNGPRLSTSSHSSVSGLPTNLLLNGILPTHRYSQSWSNAPILGTNISSNPLSNLRKGSQQMKRSERIRQLFLRILLTIALSLFFLTTIEFNVQLLQKAQQNNVTNSTRIVDRPLRSFFTSVWFYNLLLFFICFLIYFFVRRRNSRRNRTFVAFIRDFIQIFDDEKTSTNTTFTDYLLKMSFLCLLWYLSCYLFLRSMSILISTEIVILFSITVTLRQLLGWIFLHEQFIGNKIIAHILALSGFLFLAHNDGFRFNRFLLGLSIVTCSMAFKTTFDILVNGFVKDLNQTKLTLVMINVSFFGTIFLWPIVLLVHLTRIEYFDYSNVRSIFILIALSSALAFNLLTIVIPFQYISICSSAYFLFVIPSSSVLDRYLFGMKFSPLVISAIICSCAGVLLSMVPKNWFQTSETGKMKQALALLNKDGSTNPNGPTANSTNLPTGTSSAFEEIRAQRRMRNALLYNDGKT